MSKQKLVFVYNVDASPLALLRDLHQGITTGSTDCNLCDLTFGRLMKKPAWVRFVKQLPVETEFRMRSTFQRLHPAFAGHKFPAVFWEEDGVPVELLGASELDQAQDLESLRHLVQARLAERGRIPADAVPATP